MHISKKGLTTHNTKKTTINKRKDYVNVDNEYDDNTEKENKKQKTD